MNVKGRKREENGCVSKEKECVQAENARLELRIV
jgi:hypothetical protein